MLILLIRLFRFEAVIFPWQIVLTIPKDRSAVKSAPAVSHHLQIFKEPYGFSPYARVYSKRHANFQKKRKKSENILFLSVKYL